MQAVRADAATPDGSVASDAQSPATGRGRGRGRARIARPRIDIDDQIREANRVSDLLKKMGQAAKTLKKSQTKAKQRLIKKASRLKPEDLERIAVLKRVFAESEETAGDDAGSSSGRSCSTTPSPTKGIADMHDTLKNMMEGVSGADDVVSGLSASYSLADKQGTAISSADASEDGASSDVVRDRSKVMKRLSSLGRLPGARREGAVADGAMCDDSQAEHE